MCESKTRGTEVFLCVGRHCANTMVPLVTAYNEAEGGVKIIHYAWIFIIYFLTMFTTGLRKLNCFCQSSCPWKRRYSRANAIRMEGGWVFSNNAFAFQYFYLF